MGSRRFLWVMPYFVTIDACLPLEMINWSGLKMASVLLTQFVYISMQYGVLKDYSIERKLVTDW